jgi:3-hydroxyisobutyrate dehydrogenase-like beta-hydroxyacid dehydrogenase
MDPPCPIWLGQHHESAITVAPANTAVAAIITLRVMFSDQPMKMAARKTVKRTTKEQEGGLIGRLVRTLLFFTKGGIVRAVGLLSPGDMGHTVAKVLQEKGMPVLTNLSDRSERTRALARSAGVEDVLSYEELIRRTDLILSILVPAEAQNAARNIARALESTGARTTFVDCNAVSPATVGDIAKEISAAGSRFVDASIIGPPPRREDTTRFYASGQHAEVFAELSAFGLDIFLLGRHIGQASGLKMAYAAFTKGATALSTELLTAAHAMGLYDTLVEELQHSQPEGYRNMVRAVPAVPKTAHRWAGEMEEIARTFSHLGLTPKIHQGAAEVFRFVDASPLADMIFETPNRERLLRETVEVLAKSLGQERPEPQDRSSRS